MDRLSGKLRYDVEVVRRVGIIHDRLGAFTLAAALTLVEDDVVPLRVGVDPDRTQEPPAWVGAIARVDIDVSRPEAKWTVVAGGGLSCRRDLGSAVTAGESLVYDPESFCLDRHLLYFLFALPGPMFT